MTIKLAGRSPAELRADLDACPDRQARMDAANGTWGRDLRQRMDAVIEAQMTLDTTTAGRDLLASEARDQRALNEELNALRALNYRADTDIRDEWASWRNDPAKIEQRREHDRQWLDRELGAAVGPNARVLTREQRMTDYVAARGLVRDGEEHLSLQKYLRGMVYGDWQGADAERRALAEGTLASGGAMVPAPLSARIIDRARNEPRVLQAGAVTVPMDSATLDLARVAGDPDAAWHSENVAITPSDATLERVTLRARTLAGIVQLSRELIEDASGVDDEVIRIFGQVFALKLDTAALYGTGTAPEPRGVKNTTGVTTISMGANGATPTSYDPLIDAVGTLADNNHEATGIIHAPRTARTLAKLKDSTGQPLGIPPYVADVPRYTTNQVPTNLTQGTSTTASDIFTADWRELLIGVRTGFEVQVLRERYADSRTIGLLAWFRGDVLAARPKAFVVTTGVLA
jgi:HK97 family phage major capsid protein